MELMEVRTALKSEPELKIHKSTVLLSACCRSPFGRTMGGSTRCPCGQIWHGIEVWYDESGDVMFQKISDVRDEREEGVDFDVANMR